MGKANPCVKCFFILYSVLLGIAGCVLMVLGIMASNVNHKVGDAAPGLVWIYIVAAASILLSCLGTYGAYKEKPILLRVFMSMMLTGSVILVIGAVRVSAAAPQVKELLQTHMDDIKRAIRNDYELQANLHALEIQSQCCGVTGYTDYKYWGEEIPSTCECPRHDSSGCVAVYSSSSSSSSFYPYRQDVKQVYQQACGPILLSYVDEAFALIQRLIVGFLIVAILGFLLSVTLLCQVRGYCDTEASGGSVAAASVATVSLPPYASLYKGDRSQELSLTSTAWP
ncbi:tetraspanin-8-like [Centroberyx affinis]|uniref:tetraspanin-8-like n=1 Tax=Centroberyx affinis TaxID=166261 RepID=UPI003A5C4B38